MDEALLKSGQFPNVAILAGSDPKEVMREHGQVIQNGEKYEIADTREQLLNGICGTKSEKTPEIARQDGVLNISDVQDTRERLEAWAHEEIAERWAQSDREAMMIMDDLLDLLDRQAAITTAYCTSEDESCCEACRAAQKRRIAELTAERDRLQGANDFLADGFREIQAERDQLKADLKQARIEWESERDYANQCDERAEYNSHGWAKANMGWAEANAEAEQWRQKCDQLKADLKTANDTINTLRASVAGLKETVEKLGARNE